MSQAPQITEAYVRELATEQSFDRGYRYYRDRSVFDITRRGNLLSLAYVSKLHNLRPE